MPQMTIWRMRIACWIPKATDTHSEYVIHIDFPPHQWLHECSSLLRPYARYLSCLLFILVTAQTHNLYSIQGTNKMQLWRYRLLVTARLLYMFRTPLQWQPTSDILTGYISSRPMTCTSGCYYSF